MCIRVLLASLVIIAASSMAASVEPARKWALLIHTGPAGIPEVKRLEASLTESWGFDADTVKVVYDDDATVPGIRDAMTSLYEEFRPGDEIYVHLSLPVAGENEEPSFLAFDSEPDSPWSMFELGEFAEFLNALPSQSALIVLPSCPYGLVPAIKMSKKMRRGRFIEILEFGKRFGPVDVMQVCDEVPGGVGRRIYEREHPEFEPGQRRGELISRILTALDENQGMRELTAPRLADAISGGEHGFSTRVTRIPEYERRGWAFQYAPLDFGQYQAPYLDASSRAERKRVIESMATSATKSGDAFAPTMFLKSLTLSTDALLPDSVRPADKLNARHDAVGALASVQTDSARDALRTIARDADDASLRRAAVLHIARSRGNGDDQVVLRDALQDSEASVREAAVRAMITRNDADHIDDVAAMIAGDSAVGVRVAAIQAVSFLRPDTNGDAVRAALADNQADVRRQAAVALGRMGRSAASTSLLLERMTGDPAEGVREAAASALGKTSIADNRNAVVRALRTAATRSDDATAVAATYSLGDVGGNTAESALRRILKDGKRPTAVRVAAAEALGKTGGARAESDLRVAASDPSPDLRRAAVDAIGGIGGDRAAEILLEKLSDEDRFVRAAAQQALDQLKDPALDSLLSTLTDPDAPAAARAEAVRKVSASGSPETVALLIDVLGDREAQVREAAIDELVRLESPAVIEELGELLRYDKDAIFVQSNKGVSNQYSSFSAERLLQARSAAIALGHMVDGLARVPLLEAANTEGNPARLQAIESLGLADCLLPFQVRRLGTTRIYSERRQIRSTYQECVINGGEVMLSLDPILVNTMLAATEDRDLEIRAAAVRSLSPFAEELDVYSKLEALALNDPSKKVRSAAIDVLGTTGKRSR